MDSQKLCDARCPSGRQHLASAVVEILDALDELKSSINLEPDLSAAAKKELKVSHESLCNLYRVLLELPVEDDL